MKREANFSVLLRHWLKANPRLSCALEIKQTTSNSLPFSAVKQHQLDYSLAIKSDRGTLIRVQGVNGEPDYIYCRNMPAYIVIKYPKSFHLIDVETFIKERDESKPRSLTEKRAGDISTVSVDL